MSSYKYTRGNDEYINGVPSEGERIRFKALNTHTKNFDEEDGIYSDGFVTSSSGIKYKFSMVIGWE